MATEIPTAPALRTEKEHLAEDFTRVAEGYDRLCEMNPGYQKHLAMSAERLGLAPRSHILDLCCGTGLSTLALRRTYPDAEITGMDNAEGMLAIARRKPELAGVRWGAGDAMDPAASGAAGPYDGILMAYGIRNVVDPDTCLARLRTLLSPGGTLCLHEYSVADSLYSRMVWNAVTGTIVIPLGLAITGTSTIFRYLRRSVLAFDGVERLTGRLRDAGYVDVRCEPMDGWQRGIVHSFLARNPVS